MRRVEVLSAEELQSNVKFPTNTPFERAVLDRSLVVRYAGGKIEILKDKKCVRQMPDLTTPVGYDILFLPIPGGPQIIPALISTDVWCGEVILEFVDDNVTLVPGDPLALAMAVPRAETTVRVMNAEEHEEYQKRKKSLAENRELVSTRSENHNGFVVDNAYEVIVKNAKPVGQPAFFRRVIK